MRAARDFLDGEIAKYETWEAFRSNKSIRPIIKTEPEFRSIKGKGVGQTTILKFLGANWKQWMVQLVLFRSGSTPPEAPALDGQCNENQIPDAHTDNAAMSVDDQVKAVR